MEAGELLHKVRRRHGLTQAQLARRAGTTRSSISRIERGHVSPTIESLTELLFLMGEDLILEAQPRDSGIDREGIRERLAMTPGERVERGLAMARELIEEQQRQREGRG